MGKYIFDLNKIQEGDILLLNVDPRISAIMNEKTGSVYHHAMLYTGGSSHIHSNKGPGVQAENTVRMLFHDKDAAIALRLKNALHNHLLGNIIDNARTKIGTEYSGAEAKRTILRRNEDEFEPNRQFCTRFVAQAFADGGLKIVEDANYCTPFDLANSDVFTIIKNVLKEANAEELEYASEENTLPSQQIDIHNHILSRAREMTGSDIQTINQLTEFLISHPEYDKEITTMIKKSGYLQMWEKDMHKNPAYYDFNVFTKDIDKKKWVSASIQLAEVAEDNMYRYETNLYVYRQQYKVKPLEYIDVHIKLYEKLIEVTAKMMSVAKQLQAAIDE